MTLEERISRLEDIEAIRYLQAKYQRCLDSRDFDGLAECFTDDAESSYCDGKKVFHSKDEILHFLMDVMSLSMPSAHFIHGGEIDWVNPTFAKAKWYLEDHLHHKRYFLQLHGSAIYDVEYQKIDQEWKIKKIGYHRGYEYAELRGPINLLTLRKTNLIKKTKKTPFDSLGKYGKEFRTKSYKKHAK